MVRFRPEDYPDLSPDQIYYLIEERSLGEARLAYKERYGRPYNAKEIGAEIDELFRDWAGGYFDENDIQGFERTIEVAPHLLLGLLLREGAGRGRGRPRGDIRQLHARFQRAYYAHRKFKKLRAGWKDALIAAGKEKPWAADEAYEEALEAVSKWYGLPKNTILRPGRIRRRKRPTKRASIP
jgi:hypothetical protein